MILSRLPVAAVGSIVGTMRPVFLDPADLSQAPTGTAKTATLANLRTKIFAGGTGFTATDPLVAGSITVNGGAAATGTIYKGAAQGLAMLGIVGSSYDFALLNPAGSQYIMRVPTGTQNVDHLGAVSATTLATTGTVAGSAVTANVQSTGYANVDLQVAGTRFAGIATSDWALADAASDLAIYSVAAKAIKFVPGAALRGQMTSGGVLAWGTTVTTSASAGDLVLARNTALRGVNTAGTDTKPLIGFDGQFATLANGQFLGEPTGPTVDGDTACYILRRLAGANAQQKITIGAVDSGGAGFRVLRIPN